jgi:hypothetical protein
MEIVGTWKFLSYVRTDPVTGKNTNIFLITPISPLNCHKPLLLAGL